MNEHVPGSKMAERLLTAPAGATMDEIVAATGGPQYNVLRRLEGRGYTVRKVKEGRVTRYFAEPPPAPSFEANRDEQGAGHDPKGDSRAARPYARAASCASSVENRWSESMMCRRRPKR